VALRHLNQLRHLYVLDPRYRDDPEGRRRIVTDLAHYFDIDKRTARGLLEGKVPVQTDDDGRVHITVPD
jgi:hypothetical protein